VTEGSAGRLGEVPLGSGSEDFVERYALGLRTVPAVAVPLQIDRAPEAVLHRRPPHGAERTSRACVRMIERYVIGIEAS